MKSLNHILVTLDLTDIDQILIRYVNMLVRYFQPERVTFLHVIQAYNLADRSHRDFPEVETELNGIIREKVLGLVDTNFREDVNWVVDTEVGYEDAADEVIRYVKANHVDLTMLGHKYGENREGRYGRKISSEVESNVMLVPEFGAGPMHKICCAIDFSDASSRAFELALNLSGTFNLDLIGYFLIDPSRTYFPVTSRGASRQKEKAYFKTAETFLNSYNMKLDDLPLYLNLEDHRASEAQKSYSTAQQEEVDLIVVGARGQSAVETSFLGNLIRGYRLMELETPVLFVKSNREGFLDKIWPG